MGACEYCGEHPASLEVMDDDMDGGCAMVCYGCYPNYALRSINVWQRVIDEELVMCCLGVADDNATYEQAKKAVQGLIAYNITLNESAKEW